jgi:hypothetical protein
VLNWTLILLWYVIVVMIYSFVGLGPQYRIHLYIFLGVTTALLASVNWFIARFHMYGDEADAPDEETEQEETAATPAHEAAPAKAASKSKQPAVKSKKDAATAAAPVVESSAASTPSRRKSARTSAQ